MPKHTAIAMFRNIKQWKPHRFFAHSHEISKTKALKTRVQLPTRWVDCLASYLYLAGLFSGLGVLFCVGSLSESWFVQVWVFVQRDPCFVADWLSDRIRSETPLLSTTRRFLLVNGSEHLKLETFGRNAGLLLQSRSRGCLQWRWECHWDWRSILPFTISCRIPRYVDSRYTAYIFCLLSITIDLSRWNYLERKDGGKNGVTKMIWFALLGRMRFCVCLDEPNRNYICNLVPVCLYGHRWLWVKMKNPWDSFRPVFFFHQKDFWAMAIYAWRVCSSSKFGPFRFKRKGSIEILLHVILKGMPQVLAEVCGAKTAAAGSAVVPQAVSACALHQLGPSGAAIAFDKKTLKNTLESVEHWFTVMIGAQDSCILSQLSTIDQTSLN